MTRGCRGRSGYDRRSVLAVRCSFAAIDSAQPEPQAGKGEHVQIDRGWHRRLRDGRPGGAPGRRPGRAVGATLEIVSAYEPVPAQRLREERRDAPEDLQWAINPREDVDATLEAAAAVAREAGVEVERLPTPGRSGRRDPRRRRRARGRPDRGRQQGHDRRQALPAGLGAEQGLPPRALLGADHQDDLSHFSVQRDGLPRDGVPSEALLREAPACSPRARHSSRPVALDRA